MRAPPGPLVSPPYVSPPSACPTLTLEPVPMTPAMAQRPRGLRMVVRRSRCPRRRSCCPRRRSHCRRTAYVAPIRRTSLPQPPYGVRRSRRPRRRSHHPHTAYVSPERTPAPVRPYVAPSALDVSLAATVRHTSFLSPLLPVSPNLRVPASRCVRCSPRRPRSASEWRQPPTAVPALELARWSSATDHLRPALRVLRFSR